MVRPPAQPTGNGAGRKLLGRAILGYAYVHHHGAREARHESGNAQSGIGSTLPKGRCKIECQEFSTIAVLKYCSASDSHINANDFLLQ